MTNTRLLSTDSLSETWLGMLEAVLEEPLGKCGPILAEIRGIEASLPAENLRVRSELDNLLIATPKCVRTEACALTIFPYRLWTRRRDLSHQAFADLCKSELFPRLKKLDRRNRRGVYFERLINFSSEVDQVNEVIDRMTSGIKFRPTGLQMACFDPTKDHSAGRMLGFPCLQQVGVTFEPGGGFSITGFYPTQYVVSRAYGNLLGLSRLGEYLSFRTGCELSRVAIFVTRPLLGIKKKANAIALLSDIKSSC
ncbi:thymidylate synthase [Calycomorphotria hydatis]|uniref:Thymidylate synthase n=1 Tax=Calycomorphotria hydatis TaxID=2528027 RepID=A0A517TDN8_9PLAN|nr:thymidylate synthase [Calycomorphotria hydatis]